MQRPWCWILLGLAALGAGCKSVAHGSGDQGSGAAAKSLHSVQASAEGSDDGRSAVERALHIIRQGDELELFALDGDKTRMTEQPGSSDMVVPGHENAVIATPVIDSVRITEAKEKQRASAAALSGLAGDATAGWCFEPHHALRAKSGADEVTLVLCFKCASAWLLGPNVKMRFAINQDTSRELDSILALHQVSRLPMQSTLRNECLKTGEGDPFPAAHARMDTLGVNYFVRPESNLQAHWWYEYVGFGARSCYLYVDAAKDTVVRVDYHEGN